MKMDDRSNKQTSNPFFPPFIPPPPPPPPTPPYLSFTTRHVPILTLLAKKMEMIRVFTMAKARQAMALITLLEAASPALASFPHDTLFHSRSPMYMVPALERKSEETIEAAILALQRRRGKVGGWAGFKAVDE